MLRTQLSPPPQHKVPQTSSFMQQVPVTQVCPATHSPVVEVGEHACIDGDVHTPWSQTRPLAQQRSAQTCIVGQQVCDTQIWSPEQVPVGEHASVAATHVPFEQVAPAPHNPTGLLGLQIPTLQEHVEKPTPSELQVWVPTASLQLQERCSPGVHGGSELSPEQAPNMRTKAAKAKLRITHGFASPMPRRARAELRD